tara:strand:+ start:3199 stop:3453 length:255 start_codon:yes stop_codon:yes gene_type:complete
VRNEKVLGVGNVFAQIQDIEVDDSGRVRRTTGSASEFDFDSLSLLEEACRSPAVVDFDYRIKKVGRILRTIHRGATVDWSLYAR